MISRFTGSDKSRRPIGNIQIYTNTTTEATKLKESKGWLGSHGAQAELMVPTYGVITHGFSTNSINTNNQKATIKHILADNHTVIPSVEIS
jgi:hypothetical protein